MKATLTILAAGLIAAVVAGQAPPATAPYTPQQVAAGRALVAFLGDERSRRMHVVRIEHAHRDLLFDGGGDRFRHGAYATPDP